MKKCNYLLRGSNVLFASILLFSCSKQITEPTAEELTTMAPGGAVAASLSPTDCRPAVFGVFADGTTSDSWTTIAQKWYSGGRVQNLKVHIGHAPGHAGGLEPALNVDWGEVMYQGTGVMFRDLGRNRNVMRVTLNGSGQPVASYYHNQTDNFDNSYTKDTTYYFYTGSRLDSMVSLGETRFTGPNPFNYFRKSIFRYDVHGNLVQIDNPSPSPAPFTGGSGERLELKYDLTKPVSGMISNYHHTIPLRLLEYMELIKIPMYYALTETSFVTYVKAPPSEGTHEIASVIRNHKYQDYVINEGRVHSYVMPGINQKLTFYNGWECPGTIVTRTANNKKAISSVDEFKQLYRP